MNKTELIERLKKSNFTNEEIDEILTKIELSDEAKENVAVIEQIGVSATNFIQQVAKELKDNMIKYILDLILIGMFLATLIILSCHELINKENTATVFALIIGYVLAKFKKGINV